MINKRNTKMQNRKKISISLCILLVSIFVCGNLSFANEMETNKDINLPGKIMSDGSYQFSEEELARLNMFKEKNSMRMRNVTFEEFLMYCAPEHFKSLDPDVQDYLSETLLEEVPSSIIPYGSTDGPHPGTTVDISKYGNSLRARMIIDRPPMNAIPPDFAYLTAQVSIVNSSTGAEVAYAYNVENWVNGQRGKCTATAIADPPSGTYKGWGTYRFPSYHNITGWHLIQNNIYTPNFSYINPY